MSILRVTQLTPKPGSFSKGRRCAHTEDGVRCITVLCTYDEGPNCFRHTEPKLVTIAEQRESFVDLMSEAA